MKPKIALITGGYTGESVVSLKSAAVVFSHLDPSKYDVFKVVITAESWYHETIEGEKIELDRNDFSFSLNGEKISFDLAYIVLHGSPGEDGKLQGYFDMIGLKYTSCDALTSAITMNKGYTKAVVKDIADLHVAQSLQLFSNTPEVVAEIREALKLPYFVKPNNGGSSIGMSKVKTHEELEQALKSAFAEDSQVLVEEFITGREFSIGVYRSKDGIVVLPATEVIPTKEFFDFEAKYTPGLTTEITPARMTDAEKMRVERIIEEVYVKLNCRGVVRVDYFLEEGSGDFYFVEINTIPGQTETSFIPQQVKAMGKTSREFYSEIIEVSLS